MTILHGISHEHCAMHATSLFTDRSGVSHAHVECAAGMGLSQRVGKVIFPGGQQWGNFVSPSLKPRKKNILTGKFTANNNKFQNPRMAKVSLLPTPVEVTDYH